MEKNDDIESVKIVAGDIIEDTPINNTEDVVTTEGIESAENLLEHQDNEYEKSLSELKEKDNIGIYKNFITNEELKDEEIISLPTVPNSILYEYIQDSAFIKEELFNKDINTSHAVLTNLGTVPYSVEHGFFRKIKPSDDIKSEIPYKDKFIRFEEVNIRSGNTKRSAIDKIRNVTRVGKNIQLPLWNTGIRITILVPPVNAVYDLKKKLRDLNIESDVDTGGLLYSNKKIKLYKEITEFISKYVFDTTLAIPEDKTLYDFVPVQDIALEIVGASLSLYPNGNIVTIACAKTTDIINGVPKCNFVTNSKVDPRDLVKIDSTRVTDVMLDIISRRNSGSVTVQDLETYRNEYIKDDKYNTIIVPYESGELIFKLSNPVINKFITRGDKWYDDLVSKLYNVGNLTYDAKKEEIEKIIELSVLGTYNSYITSVIVEGEEFTDEETIDELLNEISQDNYLYNIYMKNIMEFISYNTIANIGTNNFLCPSCNTKQKDEEDVRNIFEMEYVWMDPIAYFLEIMNSKLTKMQKRTTN